MLDNPMTTPFIHLRAHSAYSLLEGALHVKSLVKLCARHAMPAIALTDNGNLFGSLEFSLAAAEAGIQPILGCNLFIKSDDGEARGNHHPLQHADQLLVLAQTIRGRQNILALVSKSYMAPVDGVAPLTSYAELAEHSEGLIALTAGPYGKIGKLLATGRTQAAETALLSLAACFPERLYMELMRHGLPVERKIEPGFLELAYRHAIPLVATNDIYFEDEDMFAAHDALLCIADGKYISEDDRRRLTPQHRFKSPDEMRLLFADVPEAIANTAVIARRCAVMAEARAPILPRFTLYSPDVAAPDSSKKEGEANIPQTHERSEEELLREKSRDGLEQRLSTLVFKENTSAEEQARIAKPYRERLEFELDVIIKMGFPGYFLIVSDFITWSKDQGIAVGPGRGSGAGSVVAWALLITDLDPLRYGLLFERFLNPERVSMPDFDVDFCQDRRDEVIAYVQRKYGADRVAQIITFGKLQARAVLRDVGRVLQMPYGQVDKICKLVPNNPAAPVTLEQAIQMEPVLQNAIKEEESVAALTDIGLKLEGLYRHASTHAAGVVIGDRPLASLVPLYRDEKSTMPVVQYSMKYAESAGLVKFDFLGLKTLTVLQTAVKLVARKHIHLDLLQLPEGDAKTYKMLSDGLTVGVFQLESAGMRDTLRKLKPDSLEDIIALVSLYRPGPMDNIPTYIARKHGEEKPEYLHPALEHVLKETFGVIIYQEQVMQIAQELAGYSLGEADLLRRAMGKKIRAEMEAQRDVFVTRAVTRGVVEAQAKSIFDLIAKFAEYGFNKSHAAAYALIAYQTAYIKANFPVEFLAASMTYDMHNTDKLAIFRQEARKFGIRMLPPDINHSAVQFEVEYITSPTEKGQSAASDEGHGQEGPHPSPLPEGEGAIRYALAAIKNVGSGAMQAVVDDRAKHGPFVDMIDFATRTDARVMNKRQLEFLVKAGAFDALEANRARVFESIDMLAAYSERKMRERESSQISLFGGDTVTEVKPGLGNFEDYAPLERLQHEFDALGFYLSSHPLSGYEKTLKRMHVVFSSDFEQKFTHHYAPAKVAGIVMGKKIKVSDRGRFAFLQVSDTEGVFEVSIFDEKILNDHRDALENGTLLLLNVDAKRDDNGVRLIAQSVAPLDRELLKNQRGSVQIVVDNAGALPQLKTLMGEASPDGLRVSVVTNVASTHAARIDLPGFYAIAPSTLTRIRSLRGIDRVEEV